MTNQNFVAARTDKYFTKTRNIVGKFGEKNVTYGVFIRREVIVALESAIAIIKEFCPEATITRHLPDGAIAAPKTKLMSITGPLSKLVELETIFLQKTGFACVCAYNAYRMALALPTVPFMDMHGRHATGDDMVMLAAYGASVGSFAAKLQGAKGFIGTSNDLTAKFYGTENGMGTMPHVVIGYAGTTLAATKMYVEANPTDKMVVTLVDYFGKEISDSIEVAKWFYDEKNAATKGKTLGVRLDTHGGRFLEGLNYQKSVDEIAGWLRMPGADEYAVVRKIIGDDVADAAGDQYVDQVRKLLFAQGVSVASTIHMKRMLSKNGFPQVRIIASSGFDLFKCQIFAKSQAPIDMVGTGSFLPKTISETYATADVFQYDGVNSVKVGREFLYE